MKVKGENVVLYLFIDDIWVPYACARSLNFSTSTELIETSVTGSGANATYLPTKNTASGSAEGVVAFEEDGFTTLPDLRVLQIAQTFTQFKIIRTDNAGNISEDVFSCYITSVSDSGSFDSMAQFSFDFTVSGNITHTFTPFLRFRAREQEVGNPTAFLFYLEGTPQTDDSITVGLPTAINTFTYTVLPGDTLEDIIDALFALIDPSPFISCTDLGTGLLCNGFLSSICSVEIELA